MQENQYKHVKKICRSLPLCIVSKKRSEQQILEYYNQGERIFGENHAQELLPKAEHLPKDIQWQFIGHLQRNKVRAILPYTACIQSVDNLPLAKVIDKEAARINKVQTILIELHLAQEDLNKTGLTKEEIDTFLPTVLTLPHIHVDGIMVMGPHTDDTKRIKEIFLEARDIFLTLKKKYPAHMHILSMGMSNDYPIAVECGSTMLRIGTYLFEKKGD